ncbi:hypothetical protein HU200_027918 [Digitaria exilis]|uniref:Xylanase inhibitor C-terminal domain-containing protein n=1 Tax=Digitaria exilis TaxID=1010633 RepID=A0A835EQC1_9POAL|nr:hypothetical protein HU200_027918 [Digitaria exilis]
MASLQSEVEALVEHLPAGWVAENNKFTPDAVGEHLLERAAEKLTLHALHPQETTTPEIRVGRDDVVGTSTELGFRTDGTGGVYLNTSEPYTYLESGVYSRLKVAFISHIQKLNPGATLSLQDSTPTGKLCYVHADAKLTVPSMAIVFAGDNAVMKLGAEESVWYRKGPSTVCLAILPTTTPGQASSLGSWLQSGRVMTVDVTPGTTTGTLTF